MKKMKWKTGQVLPLAMKENGVHVSCMIEETVAAPGNENVTSAAPQDHHITIHIHRFPTFQLSNSRPQTPVPVSNLIIPTFFLTSKTQSIS